MAAVFCLLLAAGCSDMGPAGPEPPAGFPVRLEVRGLPALDTATAGPFQAWFVHGDGTLVAADRFALPADGRVTVESPLDDPDRIMVTWEPPADTLASPSQLKLVGGRFEGGIARLTVTGYLTPGLPLEPAPGVHVLGTWAHLGPPGVPQVQDAGLWLMDPDKDTLSGAYYQDFAPLTEGWSYEGWVVRDHGTPTAVWLSYGKFRPDGFRQARFRDDTGLGPFSGKEDWERALPEVVRVPGDDWLVNRSGVPVPGGLELPLDLNGDADGAVPSRWTHVITVEPYEDRHEEPWTAVPTFLRPYRNAIGEGPPEERRVIEFHPEEVPGGTARLGGG